MKKKLIPVLFCVDHLWVKEEDQVLFHPDILLCLAARINKK